MDLSKETSMDHSVGPDTSSGAVRGSRHRPLFIVGVDGSESGLAALRQAALDAERVDARILCAHVRRRPGMCEALACLAAGAFVISRDCRDLMEMQAWLQCVQTFDASGRPWEFTVVSGRPDRCLARIAVAEGGDALFVGRLPRTPWSRRFHRCPARRLARAHVCPIHVSPSPVS
jgi:nucleotide-binding universal stress UspA family protein